MAIATPEELQQDAMPAPWAGHGDLQPLSLGYVEGQARVNTLLAILSLAMDNGVNFEAQPSGKA